MTTLDRAAGAGMAAEEGLSALAQEHEPVLETLALMHHNTFERSGLDERSYFLCRLAALVAMDAPPVSYLVNLGAAAEAGVSAEDAQGVLVAVAPVVGSARVASAASHIIRALGLGEALAES